jgi:membrane fusion protein (multidrug efflux system)
MDARVGTDLSEVTKPPASRRWMVFAAGAILVLALLGWLAEYLLVGQYFVSTDDAYVAADSSLIASKISGYVTTVAVGDNQPVHKGDLLATIDPSDYQSALASAQADAQAAAANLMAATAQLSLQQAKIAAAQATVQGDQARLAFALQNQRRYARLTATGASPIQTSEQASTDTKAAQATLAADQAALLGANRQVAVLNAAQDQARAAQAQAAARVQQAQLDLSHTRITAPFDGIAGNKTVSTGDYLQTGTQIMAIVPLGQVYVLANYKESQITHIQPGQHVTLSIDAFPSLRVTGTVDSIAPASGQEFALLPPDNATGNFTKIVQRIPIKIDLNLTPSLIGKLLPGLSVEPSIDTRTGP